MKTVSQLHDCKTIKLHFLMTNKTDQRIDLSAGKLFKVNCPRNSNLIK